MVFLVLTTHLFLHFTSTQHGSTIPSPCGPIPRALVPPQLQLRQLTLITTPNPTVSEDALTVQANARLAAHLWAAPAPHIVEEDAEPTEDLPGEDFTYSPETTTAFQELLQAIDVNTRELPSALSPAHYAALTQLPLTYPWARLVLDLKELLLSFDRHLITCLIANNVQGNATPHPGTVLSSFLHHLAQLILLIIAPHDADDPPPFLHHHGAYVLSKHNSKVSSSLSTTDTISTQDEPLSPGQSWLLLLDRILEKSLQLFLMMQQLL